MDIIIPGKKRRIHRSTSRILIYFGAFVVLAFGLMVWYIVDDLGGNKKTDNTSAAVTETDRLKPIRTLSAGNEIDDTEEDLAKTDLSQTLQEANRLKEIQTKLEALK